MGDLLVTVNDTFLEELDEDIVKSMYRQLVSNSVAFMIMTRLGIDTEPYFNDDDFRDIVNFNTQESLNALGFATSDIAEMGLSEISRTINALNRENRIIAENGNAEYNKDRNKNDGITEVMVKAEDKAKVDRIFEKLGLVPENVADVYPEKAKEKDAPERAKKKKSEADKFLDEVMAKPNPTKEEPHTVNPTEARTAKPSQSVPSSKSSPDSKDRSADERTLAERRPSVRKELKEIREEMDREKKTKGKSNSQACNGISRLLS